MQPLWELEELVQEDHGGCVLQEWGSNPKEEEMGSWEKSTSLKRAVRGIPSRGDDAKAYAGQGSWRQSSKRKWGWSVWDMRSQHCSTFESWCENHTKEVIVWCQAIELVPRVQPQIYNGTTSAEIPGHQKEAQMFLVLLRHREKDNSPGSWQQASFNWHSAECPSVLICI